MRRSGACGAKGGEKAGRGRVVVAGAKRRPNNVTALEPPCRLRRAPPRSGLRTPQPLWWNKSCHFMLKKQKLHPGRYARDHEREPDIVRLASAFAAARTAHPPPKMAPVKPPPPVNADAR